MIKFEITLSALIKTFQGINTPIPCNKNVKYTKLYLSFGVFNCKLASSIVKLLKFNSSSGKLLSSHDGCKRTGCCCCFSTPPSPTRYLEEIIKTLTSAISLNI